MPIPAAVLDKIGETKDLPSKDEVLKSVEGDNVIMQETVVSGKKVADLMKKHKDNVPNMREHPDHRRYSEEQEMLEDVSQRLSTAAKELNDPKGLVALREAFRSTAPELEVERLEVKLKKANEAKSKDDEKLKQLESELAAAKDDVSKMPTDDSAVVANASGRARLLKEINDAKNEIIVSALKEVSEKITAWKSPYSAIYQGVPAAINTLLASAGSNPVQSSYSLVNIRSKIEGLTEKAESFYYQKIEDITSGVRGDISSLMGELRKITVNAKALAELSVDRAIHLSGFKAQLEKQALELKNMDNSAPDENSALGKVAKIRAEEENRADAKKERVEGGADMTVLNIFKKIEEGQEVAAVTSDLAKTAAIGDYEKADSDAEEAITKRVEALKEDPSLSADDKQELGARDLLFDKFAESNALHGALLEDLTKVIEIRGKISGALREFGLEDTSSKKDKADKKSQKGMELEGQTGVINILQSANFKSMPLFTRFPSSQNIVSDDDIFALLTSALGSDAGSRLQKLLWIQFQEAEAAAAATKAAAAPAPTPAPAAASPAAPAVTPELQAALARLDGAATVDDLDVVNGELKADSTLDQDAVTAKYDAKKAELKTPATT